jgi:hypothetical protein
MAVSKFRADVLIALPQFDSPVLILRMENCALHQVPSIDNTDKVGAHEWQAINRFTLKSAVGISSQKPS